MLVSDEIARCGLELTELAPSVIESLDGLLPPFWSHSNPVDMVATVTPGGPEAVVETLVADDLVDAVIVMGVVGSMSESRRAVEEIEALKKGQESGNGVGPGRGAGNSVGPGQEAGNGAGVGRSDPRGVDNASCPDVEGAELALSERELAFINQSAILMDRYCKPVVNVSQRPMTQAIFSAGGRYSTFVLPSPLRAVRILGKMAAYSTYLQKKGRDLRC